MPHFFAFTLFEDTGGPPVPHFGRIDDLCARTFGGKGPSLRRGGFFVFPNNESPITNNST